jgi:hypothetical protein
MSLMIARIGCRVVQEQVKEVVDHPVPARMTVPRLSGTLHHIGSCYLTAFSEITIMRVFHS